MASAKSRFPGTAAERVLVQKVVHHFLFEPVGGDVTLHDHEYDVVEWVDIHEAPARMSYANERAVVERDARCSRT